MASQSRVVRMVINAGILQRASQTTVVRDALRARARQIASRAKQLDSTEGEGSATIFVVEGIRPGGRAYANVTSTDVSGEFGTSKTARRRTLGRAADIQE